MKKVPKAAGWAAVMTIGGIMVGLGTIALLLGVIVFGGVLASSHREQVAKDKPASRELPKPGQSHLALTRGQQQTADKLWQYVIDHFYGERKDVPAGWDIAAELPTGPKALDQRVIDSVLQRFRDKGYAAEVVDGKFAVRDDGPQTNPADDTVATAPADGDTSPPAAG